MARPARITRELVLRTALDLADADGLEAVTMQAIGHRLGVTPMALYRHVAGKAEVLDGLVELLLTSFEPPAAGLPWEERLTALSDGVRATARAHPGVFPLLLRRPANTPEARRVRDAVCAALTEAGVPPGRVAQAERLISTTVLGFAVSEVAGRFGRHDRAVLDDDFARLREMLGGFVAGLARDGRGSGP